MDFYSLSNPQAILERIADFKERLDQVAETIQADNEEAIWSFFHEGRKHRKEMQIHQRAGRDSAYDLFIDVPDKEGVILEILQLLQGISWSIFTSMKRIVKISTGFCS